MASVSCVLSTWRLAAKSALERGVALHPLLAEGLLQEQESAHEAELSTSSSCCTWKPLYLPLIDVLFNWATSATEPHRLLLPTPPLLSETPARRARLEELLLIVRQDLGKFGQDAFMSTIVSADQLQQPLYDLIFSKMSVADILSLLSYRTTVGSVCVFPPPSLSAMIKVFSEPHGKDIDVAAQRKENRRKFVEKLMAAGKFDPTKHKLGDPKKAEVDEGASSHHISISVGARAFAKHCLRDAKGDGFWGTCHGPNQVQNEHARKVLFKILSNAVWINLHRLPHDHAVLEVRVAEGHGARWMLDTQTTTMPDVLALQSISFRGFLEPTMEDGHASKWRH